MNQIDVLLIGIAAILLSFIIYFTTAPRYKYDADTNKLATKIDALYLENEYLSKTLSKYEVTEQYLQDLGATPEQAQEIIKASEVHNVSPKSSGS